MARYIHTALCAARAARRRLTALMLVFIGVVAAAPAQATTTNAINERVERVRMRLHEEQRQSEVPASVGNPIEAAQWANWGNWNNWVNWNNWGNWGNWPNF
jgi:hypothetical protein